MRVESNYKCGVREPENLDGLPGAGMRGYFTSEFSNKEGE